MASRIIRSAFEAALDGPQLRQFSLVFLAFLGGVSMILFVILFLFYSQGSDASPTPQVLETMTLLSGVLGAMALGVYAVQGLLYRTMLHSGAAPSASASASVQVVGGTNEVLQRILRAEIVRAALFEGVALFGLGITIFAALQGVLQAHPLYWINVVPAIAFIGYGVLHYPSRERMITTFRTHFEGL